MAELEWTRELRTELLQLHRRHGGRDEADAVRELVLRLALELSGAAKGLLLSRRDEGATASST
jgi:hypothetical protein